jgi:hypothetical protein
MFRKLATGVALSAALLMPLAACGSSADKSGGPAKPAASPSPKPAELLSAAVTKTKAVNVSFNLDGGDEDTTGAYDVTKKMGTVDLTNAGEQMHLVVAEKDLYMLDVKDLGGKNLHMVVAKFPAEHGMLIVADPAVALAMLEGAVTVTSPTPNSFQGTIDLAKVKAATPGGTKMLEGLIKAGGAKANAVEFTAKVDAQGYVAEFNTRFPGADQGKDMLYNITFSNFGAPVTVTVPTAKLVEAPAASYQP